MKFDGPVWLGFMVLSPPRFDKDRESRNQRQEGSRIRSALLSPYGHPLQCGASIRAQYHHGGCHEEAQYPWNYRWSDLVDCCASLGSVVARNERGGIP